MRRPFPALDLHAARGLRAALVLLLCPGCVERLLEIRSRPEGAQVFVNGEPAGVTPLDHPFDFYGTFDITLRSGRHLSTRRLEKVGPPWYEVFPIDFVSENLVPFKIRDRRRLDFELTEMRLPEEAEARRAREAVLSRQEALERQAESSPPSPR